MLFAVNAAGVPSVAPLVSLQRVAAPDAQPAGVNLALGRPATGSTPCVASEGPAKAVNGSVSGGLSDKCTITPRKCALRAPRGHRLRAPLVAYAGADATGRSQRFEAGSYDVVRGNLGLIGNDAARAVEVAPGYQATICRDTGLTGGCTTLSAGRHAPLPAGLDLAMSSVRVVRGG
jgi:hypothetical protein